MTSPARIALATAAGLLLCSCEAQVKIDLPADQTGNDIANAIEQTISPAEPRRDQDQARVPGPAKEIPKMPQPKPTTNPPAPKPPATRPQPEVRPTPLQRPDEVDPVHRDPGDEVPL